MAKLVDMTGKKYGRLYIVRREGATPEGRAKWLCKCDCGNEKIISGKTIRNGDSLSCGCLHIESSIKNLPKNECEIGSTRKTKKGYIQIKTEEGWKQEHVYVMEKYIGRKLHKDEIVHHKDHNKTNNCISNLKIMRHGEHSTLHNLERTVSEETKKRISESHKKRTKEFGHRGINLTENDVIEIRKEYITGAISYSMLARKYKVTPASIRNVITRKTWRYVNG